MALNSLICADVPLRSCSLTHDMKEHHTLHFVWFAYIVLLQNRSLNSVKKYEYRSDNRIFFMTYTNLYFLSRWQHIWYQTRGKWIRANDIYVSKPFKGFVNHFYHWPEPYYAVCDMIGLYMPRESLFCTACRDSSDGSMDAVDSTRSDVRLPFDDNRRGHIENVQEVDVKDEVLDEKTSDVLSESIPDRRRGRRVTCSICRKRYHPDGLKRHISIHFALRPDKCPICCQKCSLSSHVCPGGIASVLGPRKMQACGVCGVRVSSDLMERHMRTHRKRSEFICHICNQEFKNQSNLDRHVQNHDRYNALIHVVVCIVAMLSKLCASHGSCRVCPPFSLSGPNDVKPLKWGFNFIR